jgi:hypothetical protein
LEKLPTTAAKRLFRRWSVFFAALALPKLQKKRSTALFLLFSAAKPPMLRAFIYVQLLMSDSVGKKLCQNAPFIFFFIKKFGYLRPLYNDSFTTFL